MMMPTGFRFNPTDEELIQILQTKASGQPMPLHFNFIVQRNVYEHDPQHLQWDDETVGVQGDKERYCFCMKENDSREVSGQGWWKATGHVKKIYASDNQTLVGYKRPLAFHRFKDYQRKRSDALKTNWIMHEYSLVGNHTTEWRLCRVKHKGKPSAQEELENTTRKGSSSSSMSTQPDFVGDQVLQNPDNTTNYYGYEADDYFLQNMQQQQQQQTLLNDPIFQTQFSTNCNCLGGDQQTDDDHSSEQLFPSLWSWQN